MDPAFVFNFTSQLSMTEDAFSSFPEELVERIVSYATIIPGELDIVHPADGNDPFFRTFTPVNADYFTSWENTLNTRAALVRVSRRFWRVATPFLYSSLCISYMQRKERAKGILSSIEENPHLASLVRRLSCRKSTASEADLKRLLRHCRNLTILHSFETIDFADLPTSLRVLNLWYSLILHKSALKSLLRLQNLEVLALSETSFRNIIPLKKDEKAKATNISKFTHLPSLRTVALRGNPSIEILRVILHQKSPIQALELTSNTFDVSLSKVHPFLKNITHLVVTNIRFFDRESIERGQVLLPRLNHLMIMDHLFKTPLADEIMMGFDTIRSLATFFSSTAVSDMYRVTRWMEHLEKRVSQRGQSNRGSSQFKLWYTNDIFPNQFEEGDSVRLREGIDKLADFGVQCVVEMSSGLTPMKDALTIHEQFGSKSAPIIQETFGGK